MMTLGQMCTSPAMHRDSKMKINQRKDGTIKTFVATLLVLLFSLPIVSMADDHFEPSYSIKGFLAEQLMLHGDIYHTECGEDLQGPVFFNFCSSMVKLTTEKAREVSWQGFAGIWKCIFRSNADVEIAALRCFAIGEKGK